jgi:hypothetical protein
MAMTGVSHKVRSTLTKLQGEGGEPLTMAPVQELTLEVLELAEVVERLSAEVDRLSDGRSRAGGAPPRS